MDKGGYISLHICTGPTPFSGKCCYTSYLDHPNRDDFEKGALDNFWGFMLGFCQDFHIPNAKVLSCQQIPARSPDLFSLCIPRSVPPP